MTEEEVAYISQAAQRLSAPGNDMLAKLVGREMISQIETTDNLLEDYADAEAFVDTVWDWFIAEVDDCFGFFKLRLRNMMSAAGARPLADLSEIDKHEMQIK